MSSRDLPIYLTPQGVWACGLKGCMDVFDVGFQSPPDKLWAAEAQHEAYLVEQRKKVRE